MDFLSSIGQLEGWQIGLLLLPLIPVLILVIYIMYGLVVALLMLSGRWKTEIISGRLESVGEIADTQSINTYNNAVLSLDGQPEPIAVKKLLLGAYLRKANVLRLDGRFILLVRRRASNFNKVKLLGLADGREIHFSTQDLKTLGRLEWAQCFFLAIFASIPGFVFLTPPLIDRGQIWPGILAGLACGLIPAAVLCGLHHLAATKFAARARAELEGFARIWSTGNEDVRTRALPPLAAGNGMESVATAVGLAGLGLPFLLLKWFCQLLTVFGSAFVNPTFEMRPLRISEQGQAHKDANDLIFLKNAVLQDPFSGVRKKVKKARPAANLIKAGLFDQGLEGLWMIQANKLGHPATEETIGSLKMAAYIEEAKTPRININFADLLALYNYTPVMAPLAAGLTGAFIGAIVIINQTETLTTWVDFLWLIPATVLPAGIMVMARRRIMAAAGKCLRHWAVLNNVGPDSYELVDQD